MTHPRFQSLFWVWLRNPGLPSSFLASTILHLGLLLAGYAAWSHSVGAPVPSAVEVTLGDFSIEQGVARERKEKKVIQNTQKASPVDMNVVADKSPKPKEVSQEGAPLKEGHGGESAASQARSLSEWERYQASIHDRVHDALLYPRMSKNLGETGRVKVRFTILRDGTISDVGLSGPSAFDRLNSAAVETVRRIAKLDPLPPSYAGEAFQTIIPIDYVLR